MKPTLKIAGIQMACEVGASTANLQKALVHIREAARSGAQIICLPESFAYGYELATITKQAGPLPNEISEALRQAAQTEAVHIVAGLPYRTEQGVFNASLLFSPQGGAPEIYRKMHLFSMPDLYEKGHFLRGPLAIKTHSIAGCTVGLMICYDLRFPELARRLALAGVDLLIVISAWPLKRLPQFRILGACRAIENQCYVLAVNRTGTDAGCEFGGHTTLFDPLGQPVAGSLQSQTEGVALVEVDPAVVRFTRAALPCLQDRYANYGL